MAAQVVPFSDLTPEQALGRIRRLSAESVPIGLARQPRKQLRQRRASWPQIKEVLRTGSVVDDPSRDLAGDWSCRLSAFAIGRNVQVEVLMIGAHRLVIRTLVG